jgi:hypothetical protein
LDNTDTIDLGTTNPTRARHSEGGGTLYRRWCRREARRPWTTTVTVPASATYTTADVLEETIATPLAPNLADQSSSRLTIPGQFAQLVIKLRRDASTLLKGAKIASARVSYDDPSHPDARVVYPYEVLPCTDTTYGTLPQPGIPCIRTRTEYTKKNAPTADWVGDWEFEILANDNGRYTN